MRLFIFACFIGLFSCTKDNQPEVKENPLTLPSISSSTVPALPDVYNKWVLSSSSRVLISGDPWPSGINGKFINRYEDSVEYDAQFRVTNTYQTTYKNDTLITNSSTSFLINGAELIINYNGNQSPAGTINPDTKTLYYMPTSTVTKLATNGMTDTLITGGTRYLYDAVNTFCTGINRHTFKVLHTNSGSTVNRVRHDDLRTINYDIQNKLILREEEYLTQTDSFFSASAAQSPYRLDSVKSTTIKTLERNFTYDTTLGIVDPVLPYNRGLIPGYLQSSVTLLKNASTQPGIWQPTTIGTTLYSYVFKDGLLVERTEQSTDSGGKTRIWRSSFRYRKRQ